MFKKGVTICSVAAMLSILSFSAAFAATDEETSRSIRKEISAVDKDPFSLSRVDVLTKDGTVYLRGSVEYVSQSAKAEEIAKATPGVNRVINQLNVGATN